MQLATSQSISQFNDALKIKASFSLKFNKEAAIEHLSDLAAAALKKGATLLLNKVVGDIEATAQSVKGWAIRADKTLMDVAQATANAGFAAKCHLRDRYEDNLEREEAVVKAVTFAATKRTVKLAKKTKRKALRAVAVELKTNVRPTLKTRWVSPWQAHDAGIRNLLEKCYRQKPSQIAAEVEEDAPMLSPAAPALPELPTVLPRDVATSVPEQRQGNTAPRDLSDLIAQEVKRKAAVQ
jgi:hypothetical protein